MVYCKKSGEMPRQEYKKEGYHTVKIAYYHLPGLFEFYPLYRLFLPLYRQHREWFYDWCRIGSIYGAPQNCIWGGGRVSWGDADPRQGRSFYCKGLFPGREP